MSRVKIDTKQVLDLSNNSNSKYNFSNPFVNFSSKVTGVVRINVDDKVLTKLYTAWIQQDLDQLKILGLSQDQLSGLDSEEIRLEWIRNKIADTTVTLSGLEDFDYSHVIVGMRDNTIPRNHPLAVIRREHIFSTHIPATETNEDTHLVKELIHYQNGTTERRVRIIKNYERPVYVTRNFYRKHEQKREFEEIEKLLIYKTTQSELYRATIRKLGGVKRYRHGREVANSPYVYGLDIDSRVHLSNEYSVKWPGPASQLTYAPLDIESDVDTGDITVITTILGRKVFTVVTKDYIADKIKSTGKDILDILKVNIPEKLNGIDIKLDEIELDYSVCDTPGLAVSKVMAKLHEWAPDIIGVWNVLFDIPKMVAALENEDFDPVEVFSDPSVPKELRRFAIKEGPIKKVTESGKETPIPVEKRWNTIITTSSFTILDSMNVYYYIREGSNAIPGGYSLDNILKLNLNFGKLKMDLGSKLGKKGWHKFMSDNHKLEYIAYNIWDVLSMLILDEKNQDISTNLGALAGDSSFDKFNSGPKKIVDKLYFEALADGMVLGSKPFKVVRDSKLGLRDWILTLEAFRIADNGLTVIDGMKHLHTNIRPYVFDLDAVSSYPSNTVAANISGDTTEKEIISIQGIDKKVFKDNNINLLFGDVNFIRYSVEMLGFPNVIDLLEEEKKEITSVHMDTSD